MRNLSVTNKFMYNSLYKMATNDVTFPVTLRELTKSIKAEVTTRPNLRITDGYATFRRCNDVGTVFLYTMYCTNLAHTALNIIQKSKLDPTDEMKDSVWFVKDRNVNLIYHLKDHRQCTVYEFKPNHNFDFYNPHESLKTGLF